MFTTTPSAVCAQRGPNGLAILGRTLHDLRGIRFVDGENGNQPDPAAVAAAAAAAAAGQLPAKTTPPWGDDPTKFDPDKAWKLIENLRVDAEERQKKTDAAITAAADKARKDAIADLAKALAGGEPEETDPEKLKAKVTDLATQIQTKDSELTKAQSDVKARDISLAVALLAPALGADAEKLLAHEAFKTAIASVEPTDRAAIQAAITKAVQDTATLKATPSRSGSAEHQGATVQSLQAQLKTAEEKKDFRETIRLKRAIASANAAQSA